MKAEHRHDLKTNELAQWLMNSPVWVRENLRMITYISLVVVLVLGTFIYHRYQKTVVAGREQTAMTIMLSQLPQQEARIAQDQVRGMDSSSLLLQAAEDFGKVADTAKHDNVAALSLINQGEILRTELQFRPGTISREDAANQIARAKEKYTKAIDTYLKRTPNAPLEAFAKFGLGLCEEELGNLDSARSLYNEVATNADFAATTPATAAKRRLMLMDSFNTKVVLKPSPRLAPSAMPQTPTMQSAPGQILPPLTQPEINAPGLN